MIEKQTLPPHVKERLDWFISGLEIEEGWVCGGALRRLFAREEPKDVDVFVKDEKQRKRIIVDQLGDDKWKSAGSEPRRWIINSDLTYDVVGPTFPSIKVVLEGFDLTVAAVGIDLATKEFWCHRNFWHDLAGRRLILMPPLILPFGTLSRVIKYKGMGYSICRGQIRVLWNEIRNAEQEPEGEPFYID